MNNRPLAVDLDGTLIKTDLLIESFLSMLRYRPMDLFKLIFWLSRGKGYLKHKLAQQSRIQVERLPYHQAFCSWLQEQKQSGRLLILATGSNHKLAQKVADHTGLFDHVLASDPEVNLTGCSKRDKLLDMFDGKPFDYAGNSHQDVPVWEVAEYAVLVNTSPGVKRAAERKSRIDKIFPPEASGLKSWLKATRVHQWVKNLLLFAPLVFAHQYGDLNRVADLFLAFISFSLCASAVYIINDLLDLESDRQHRSKRYRPFASGKLSVESGLVAGPCLIIAAFFIASFLTPMFFAGLAGYLMITFAYSLKLKRIILLDVIALAVLYTSRIVVGAWAVEVPLSFWLLSFSMFLFLSLAVCKRIVELKPMLSDTAELSANSVAGRDYTTEDLPVITALGVSSGYVSVLVLALYINNPDVVQLYKNPQALWLVCPVALYWVSRTWVITHRGFMNDDPVIFAIKDRTSWIVAGIIAAAMILAL